MLQYKMQAILESNKNIEHNLLMQEILQMELSTTKSWNLFLWQHKQFQLYPILAGLDHSQQNFLRCSQSCYFVYEPDSKYRQKICEIGYSQRSELAIALVSESLG